MAHTETGAEKKGKENVQRGGRTIIQKKQTMNENPYSKKSSRCGRSQHEKNQPRPEKSKASRNASKRGSREMKKKHHEKRPKRSPISV